MRFTYRLKHSALAAAVCLSLGVCAVPVASVQAVDLSTITGVIGIVAGYSQYTSQYEALDGSKRDLQLEQMKKADGVNTDPEANAMVERVVTRLSGAIAKTDPSILKKPYQYFVNNNPDWNAYCSLGHNISVNIGLFAPLNNNENEVAFVLAHEMGHGQKNHVLNGAKKTTLLKIANELVGTEGGLVALGSNLLTTATQSKLITKPMETAADELAFQYASAAGYNPGAGAALWQRMLDTKGNVKYTGLAEIYNDHPYHQSRRDTNSGYLTNWSDDNVKVDADTGMIKVRDKDWYQPGAAANMSGKERSYLIAGNLSAAYHNGKKPVASDVHMDQSMLYVGQQPITDLSSTKDAQAVADNLKKII